MSFPVVVRFIVSVLTLLSLLGIVFFTGYSIVNGLPILATVVGVMLTGFTGFFVYRDYLHYFKHQG